MKIIKRGNAKPAWPKRGTCRSCKTVVEVNEKDVRDARDRPGEEICWMRECPACDDMIYFRP